MTDTRRYISLFLIYCFAGCVGGLECWKCISHECEGDPENNYKAYKTPCNKGDSCMKVRYTMNDNITTYDSVIRTCSAGTCAPTTEKEFNECKAKVRKFKISGCVLRSCCSDKDLCNSATPLITAKVAVLVIVSLSLSLLL